MVAEVTMVTVGTLVAEVIIGITTAGIIVVKDLFTVVTFHIVGCKSNYVYSRDYRSNYVYSRD